MSIKKLIFGIPLITLILTGCIVAQGQSYDMEFNKKVLFTSTVEIKKISESKNDTNDVIRFIRLKTETPESEPLFNNTDDYVLLTNSFQYEQSEMQEYVPDNLQEQNSYEQSFVLGDFGYLTTGSYSAQVYYGNLDDVHYSQSLVDSPYSACGSYLYNSLFIADHAYQGFNQTLYNNTLTYYDSNGNETTWEKNYTVYTDDIVHFDESPDVEYMLNLGGLVTQVCVGNQKAFIHWYQI